MAMNYDFRSIEASAYNDWIKDDVYRVTAVSYTHLTLPTIYSV